MRLLIYVTLTAALATPLHAGELDAPKRPSLTAQAQAALAAPVYSQPGSWQKRVSRSRGAGGSTKKAVLIGAIGGGLAGLVGGLVVENSMCECQGGGPGPITLGFAAGGAGAGAAIGWALSLR